MFLPQMSNLILLKPGITAAKLNGAFVDVQTHLLCRHGARVVSGLGSALPENSEDLQGSSLICSDQGSKQLLADVFRIVLGDGPDGAIESWVTFHFLVGGELSGL